VEIWCFVPSQNTHLAWRRIDVLHDHAQSNMLLLAQTGVWYVRQTPSLRRNGNGLNLDHKSRVWQCFHSDRCPRRAHLPTGKHLVPLFVHACVVSLHLSQVHHGIYQVGNAPFATRGACDDLVDDVQDCRGLLADIWHLAVHDAGDTAVWEHTRNARDIDCAAVGWQGPGLRGAGRSFNGIGIQEESVAVGSHGEFCWVTMSPDGISRCWRR